MSRKRKSDKRTASSAKAEIKKAELEVSFSLKRNVKYLIIVFLIIIPAILCYYYVSYAYSVNHENGFTLDDPWIHLTFARNLVEYGSFSYFKNQVVTAGSTSPIYTLILAIGFLITKNEMILSYILGILFLMLAVFYFFKLSESSFPKENWLAIAAALIFAIDKWMDFIAVSGMETTMYIFLLIICFYFYKKRKPVLFGLMLGLVLWGRPDAVAFIGAIIADYMIFLYMKKKSPKANEELNVFTKQELIKSVSIFLVVIAAYFAMNLHLSGSLMPNTYEAKLTYYAPEFRSRANFLRFEVWQYFTDSAYLLLIIPFFIAVLKIFIDSGKLRYNQFLFPLIFIIALVFIYWYKLPYAHRFGRYLMPIIPFYILLFIYGTREFYKYIYRYFREKNTVNSLNYIFFLIVIIYSVSVYYQQRVLYAEQTHHIAIRQVATAKWLRDHTPEGSIIATHDVGAIGYYSNREILDVAGLINPEFIKRLNDRDFSKFMVIEMKKYNVSYIAFLREWYRVVNQTPLFTTGDNNFEIMDVFKFDPNRTHILSREVNGMNSYALQLAQNRQVAQAINLLSRSVSMDPESSLSYYYLSYACSLEGDDANTVKYLKKALDIFPEYKDAALSLASEYRKLNDIHEARKYTEGYLKYNPSDSTALNLLKSLQDSIRIDK
jgi:tetratricopeptide (TPR) repeat protein